MMDQLTHSSLSSIFMAGLSMLFAQTNRSYFNQKVLPCLSFELLSNPAKVDVEDSLRFIKIFENEKKPLQYFVTENTEI